MNHGRHSKSLIGALNSKRVRRLGLTTAAAISFIILAQLPPAMAQEKDRSATVDSDETVRIWFGANYGRWCASAGPPVFNLTAQPFLGEVRTELADFTVPSGQNCAGRTYTGLRIWYRQSGPTRLSTPSSFPTNRQIQLLRKVHNPLR